MMKVHVLIDYDNLRHPERSGGMLSLARRIYGTCQGVYPQLDQLAIRLYGGWYDVQGLTQEGSRLTQELSQDFPLLMAVNGRIEGRIQATIASAPIDAPQDLLPYTFRLRKGIRSRLRFSPTQGCLNPTICSGNYMARWSKGRCPVPTCTVEAKEIFTYNEQKLVDTLLCCDLLSIAMQGADEPIFLASDDDDMVPAILMGNRIGGLVHKLIAGPTRVGAYDDLLRRGNIFTQQF